MKFEFSTHLERWEKRTEDWYFAIVPLDVADTLTRLPLPPRGFGSIKVHARIQHIEWDTSVFPDEARGTYVLPLKKSVRSRLGITPESVVDIELEVL